MIYIIGSNGYIGSNLMQALPDAIGITRGTSWPDFERDDWIINAASYFWHGKPCDVADAWNTNNLIPSKLVYADANVIQLTSTAADKYHEVDPVWSHKKEGDDKLLGKAHIIILPTIYGGINQHPHMFMTALLAHIKHGTPFELTTPKAKRDFVHISELITCIKDIIALRFRAIRKPHLLTSGMDVSMFAMMNIARGIRAECG